MADCQTFEAGLYRYFDLQHKDLLQELVKKGALDYSLRDRIGKAVQAFKAEFAAQRAAAS